ncbi:MAG: serine/threonine-protein kinase [Vicinamibacterales bacterium]
MSGRNAIAPGDRARLSGAALRRHLVWRGAEGSGTSALPSDLLEQVRGRVRLLAALLFCGYAFDVLVFVSKLIAVALGYPAPDDLQQIRPFQWVNLSAMAVSAAMWWTARRASVSASRLLSLGLVYEVAICFVMSMQANWQYYDANGLLPNLTWVPAIVILFPLVMPGPPRRLMGAAVAAAATGPLAIFVLERLGQVSAAADSYVQSAVSGAFAVGFAYMGARVVYGLGREVAAAREIGSYVLEEKLGQGGMGEVWRARHRLLARPAAIKIVRSPPGAPAVGPADDLLARFEREAQATARLRSPHTVDLFDFGVSDDGAFYYVMELLDGLDADALVRRFGPVPPERAVFLLRQVCHSLSEAEACGLVHRDIKPANVFVCRYGEDFDFVKVLDFGLVKSLDGSPSASAAATMNSVIRGTPAFIAPEQALGKADIDHRADIYAVGCLAYWLLTGQQVFVAETPMGAILDHIKTPPPPPSTRVAQAIPPALEQVVLACLAKDPEDRPQSARGLSIRLAAACGEASWSPAAASTWWAAEGRGVASGPPAPGADATTAGALAIRPTG